MQLWVFGWTYEDVSVAAAEASHPTLAESAALQQAKHSRVELKEVEVVTGEEDESNVFQVTSLLIDQACPTAVSLIDIFLISNLLHLSSSEQWCWSGGRGNINRTVSVL